MTIGDVLAAIAAVFALGTTWAATLLLVALAFPARVSRAQEKLASSPGACLARGLGVAILFLVIVVPMSHHPAGPIKLLSYLLMAGLGMVVALGSAGIARLVGERIQRVGAHMSPFASLTRGTLVYVVAGFLPVIGWFLAVPIASLLSLGSAVTVLGRRGLSPGSASLGFPSPEGEGGLAQSVSEVYRNPLPQAFLEAETLSNSFTVGSTHPSPSGEGKGEPQRAGGEAAIGKVPA